MRSMTDEGRLTHPRDTPCSSDKLSEGAKWAAIPWQRYFVFIAVRADVILPQRGGYGRPRSAWRDRHSGGRKPAQERMSVHKKYDIECLYLAANSFPRLIAPGWSRFHARRSTRSPVKWSNIKWLLLSQRFFSSFLSAGL